MKSISPHIQQAAIQQAVRQWSADLGPLATPAEMAELMDALVAGILEMHVTPAAVIDRRVRTLVGRRLLAALQGELLRSWSETGMSVTQLGAMLVAFERVRDAITPDPAQTFAAELAGRDGLHLLIDVAHDLRSPLTSILFLAETMQRGQSGPVSDVQRRQLGLIYTAAMGLSSVASDIIDLTRSELLVELKPVPFSTRSVLESVHDIVRPMAEQKQLDLRITSPAVDPRLGHPVALSRVLLNLTTNALKFTSKGFVEISAREVSPARVEFAVRDSGKGIDPKMTPTLFDPVRRAAHRHGDEHAGKLFSRTGLGLTICRKLVATMGSELQVESRRGWGTRFYFELDLPPAPSRSSGETDLGGRERRQVRPERRERQGRQQRQLPPAD